MKDRIFKILQKRWLQHLAFWGLSFFILTRHFAYEEEVHKVDLIYTLLFHLSLWLAVYINLFLLIPKLLRFNRIILYLSSVALVLAGASVFNWLTFQYLADWLFPGYYFISYFEFRDILEYILVYASITTLLKLSKGWFQLQRQEKRINRLERQKVEAELRALKAQIDPHFLFNSLNSLYSLALDRSVKVPEALLRLSECMRYMLYDCRKSMVPLEKELEYIHNYIELQRLRLETTASISMEVMGAPEGKQIAPLLFIPFIENAFKHGLKEIGQLPSVSIAIHIEEKSLYFLVENALDEERENVPARSQGIGLKNVRQRLQLLYPNRFHMIATPVDRRFRAELKIEKL